MKIIITFFGVCFLVLLISMTTIANYKYEEKIGSYWSLAEKSSTIEGKSNYIDKFVESLNSENFSSHNAIYLKTLDNSFESNLEAVKTLQRRLNEIKNMDVKSFEYQAAIEQIKGQEQKNSLAVQEIAKAWCLKNYPIVWDWIGGILLVATVVFDFSSIMVWLFYFLNRSMQ